MVVLAKSSRRVYNQVQTISEAVPSETWAPRYLTHKYWGRKPANVVRHYISHFTQGMEDPVVLDPFCGSGVTCIEALALGKRTIGVDLNPAATLITQVTALSPVDLEALDAVYSDIMKDVTAEIGWLYETKCPSCGGTAVAQSYAWEKGEPVEVRFHCVKCSGRSALKKIPDSEDLALIEQVNNLSIPYWYPDPPVFKGWQTLKLFRANLKSFSELYTKRNLWALATLWDRISKVEEDAYRQILQVAFTSLVAQGTKMIADFKENAGGPSWKINTYWLPARWQELNVLKYFANRYSKMRKAKEDTNAAIGLTYQSDRFKVYTLSATNLTPAESAAPEQAVVSLDSVDYIFTDPPYGGEGIQYLELSALWNMWLNRGQLSFEDEVAFNPHRNLDSGYYAAMLAKAFRQAYLALKPGCWMTVTFHNKDSEIWKALLSACASAGFLLESIVPMNPSAPNLTQQLTRGAPKTDLLLNFRKPGLEEVRQITFADFSFGALSDVVVHEAEDQIEKQGLTTTSQVFDAVIIKWFTANFGYVDRLSDATELDFSVFDVENVLQQHFAPTENPRSNSSRDLAWKSRSVSPQAAGE